MRTAAYLKWVERRLPRLAPRLKKAYVERAVPFNRAIGIRVDDVAADSGRVAIRLLDRRRNRNVSGTTHGGVIMALAETIHGIAVFWQFSPADHTMVTRVVRIEFLAPARGVLSVVFVLPADVQERIASALGTSGRCDVDLSSEVTDPQGKTVARLEGSYVIRRRAERGERS